MKVFVYWNIHGGLWSIKALEGPQRGRVVLRSDRVLLSNATGKVSEAGRQRVLREKRKNVHAGIVGELVHSGGEGYFPGQEVTYNPYKYEAFVYKGSEEVYKGSQMAYMENKKVLVL